MCEQGIPKGQRFSLLYLRSEETLSDCPRMRRRLAAMVDEVLSAGESYDFQAGKFLEAELGIEIVQFGLERAFVNWDVFFRDAQISDVLDAITLIYRFGNVKRRREFTSYPKWVERIFRERNLRYQVDEKCGVHPRVDSAFEQVRTSAILGLERERYNAAEAHLQSVEKAMISADPDNRQAIRSVFDAAENIFKMMFNCATHINKHEINNRLKPQLEDEYFGRDTAKRAMLKQCEGFKSWVEAAHFYRHADGQPEPEQPPDELTILMLSQGYGWVRWLAQLDHATRKE